MRDVYLAALAVTVLSCSGSARHKPGPDIRFIEGPSALLVDPASDIEDDHNTSESPQYNARQALEALGGCEGIDRSRDGMTLAMRESTLYVRMLGENYPPHLAYNSISMTFDALRDVCPEQAGSIDRQQMRMERILELNSLLPHQMLRNRVRERHRPRDGI